MSEQDQITGIESVIPDHVKPSRPGGFLARRVRDDDLLVYSRQQRCRLNPSASFVWFLCDGCNTVNAIIERARAAHPGESAQVREDTITALAFLRKEGLVRLAGDPVASRPLLQVAFSNCPPELPVDDNYFLQMLLHRFDVLIVDPGAQPPDLLLFSDAPAGALDHRDIDSADTLKVFFSAGNHALAPKDCDYEFVEDQPRLDPATLQFRLPFWATRLDWTPDKSGKPAWQSGLYKKRTSRCQALEQNREFLCAVDGDAARRHPEVMDAFASSWQQPLSLRRGSMTTGEATTALSRCKFVMLFDEPGFPAFTAEQLLRALGAGAVPLYFGDPASVQDFNPCAYVDASQFGTLDEMIDFVRKLARDEEACRHFLSAPVFRSAESIEAFAPNRVCDTFYDSLFAQGEELPHAATKTAGAGKKRPAQPALTIGMATYDDYDGVYFSVQAIRLYHPEVTDNTEILVIDNNPEGICSASLRDLERSIPGLRYIPYSEIRSTAVRDLIFREAASDRVLCMDSHVFLEAGSIARLIAYFDANQDSRDILQGPLVTDNLASVLTHFDAVWNEGMYGKWAVDERGKDPENEPFDIPMQGLGLFACRKSAWPGFNPRFRGFGGEEGYIHEKFRQRGGRALCLPFLRWVHRFNRPHGVRYENHWEGRFRNYFIGFSELGQDTRPIVEHFSECVSPQFAESALSRAEEEISNPFYYFDAIYCINTAGATERWQAAGRQFEAMGIAHRVVRFEAVETPESHHIGCALSHRRIIERARRYGYQNVLVLEDDVVFLRRTLWYLKRALDELETLDWKLFYLGGHRWGKQFEFEDGCAFLRRPATLTCTHAIAYNRSVYSKLLEDIPDELDAMREWINQHRGIDQYLISQDSRYLASPAVATQPSILGQEDITHRDEFMVDVDAF